MKNKKYIPIIKILKINNRKYDQLQMCSCGERYSEHYNKESFCEFNPIYLIENFRELFLEYLETNKFEDTIDTIFNYSDIEIEEIIVRILAGDYHFNEFSSCDFYESRLTINDIIKFCKTLVDVRIIDRCNGKYRRHRINRNRGI
jgi:predicted nucleic-acid-binding Zn-ribbon protein